MMRIWGKSGSTTAPPGTTCGRQRGNIMKKILPVLFLLSVAACLCGDSLSALFSVGISHDLKRVSGTTIAHDVGNFRSSMGFADGTATDSAQANAVYSVRGEVSSAAVLSYDLGSLTSPLGGSFAFNRVKVFAVKNLDGSETLIIGSGPVPWVGEQATATRISKGPGGLHVESSPYAGMDASTTSRVIYLESLDGLASFDLLLIGTK